MSPPCEVLRDEFFLPDNRSIGAIKIAAEKQDLPCVYLCGDGLGVYPKRSQVLIQEELEVWAKGGALGLFAHPQGRNWLAIADHVHPLMAEIVGAKTEEVCVMSTLTANLHLMMSQFYKPTSERYKIFCDANAFPSDQRAFASQVQNHGFDPKDAIIEIAPRDGEFSIREEDILDVIEKEGSKIALVLFGALSYFTGQLYPMKSITKAAKAKGCMCGWDLAHAAGNVPLSLHDWDVDFAVWCTYKYLNSGPGGIGGLFVHEKWNKETPKYAGWWGEKMESRFLVGHKFDPIPGAQGYQQSSPSALSIVSLLGSLQVFKKAGMMGPLRQRSKMLTGKLENLLRQSNFFVPPEQALERKTLGFTILTPTDPESRGAQLSLMFLPQGSGAMDKVFNELREVGVVGAFRKPDVIRFTPMPLYNTEEEVEAAARYLDIILARL